MVRYVYAWMPFLVLGTVIFLSLPWLGLIALMVFALVALAALALVVVAVPYALGRAIGRLWHAGSGAHSQTTAALSPAERRDVAR